MHFRAPKKFRMHVIDHDHTGEVVDMKSLIIPLRPDLSASCAPSLNNCDAEEALQKHRNDRWRRWRSVGNPLDSSIRKIVCGQIGRVSNAECRDKREAPIETVGYGEGSESRWTCRRPTLLSLTVDIPCFLGQS